MKFFKHITFLFFSLTLFSFTNTHFEKDKTIDIFLYKIERSKDTNIIMYNVNLTESGKLNAKKPIIIYWIKNTKKGNIEPLTWIQNKYAYGLKYTSITEDFVTFQFVSYNKITFTLKKTSEQKYNVFTKFDDTLIKVNKLYIQIDGGTFWFPNIPEIKIIGTDVKTGKEFTHIIYP